MAEEFVPSINFSPQLIQGDKQKLSETPRALAEASIESLDNTNRNFKGQQKTETVLCFTRKHWIVLLPSCLLAMVFSLVVLFFLFFISSEDIANFASPFTHRLIAFLALAGLTFYFHRFFVHFFNYYLQTTIITNFRVIALDQTLFFHRDRDSIDLPEIQNIEARRHGVIKTLFNYGEIIITLSSAHASKTLRCMPNPEYYFRKINKTKREYITKRRIEKQGI